MESLFPPKKTPPDFFSLDSIMEAAEKRLADIQSCKNIRKYQLEFIERQLSQICSGLQENYPLDYTLSFLVFYTRDMEQINHLISSLNCSESLITLGVQLGRNLSRLVRGYSKLYNK